MKTGRSINEVAKELYRQLETKEDYLAIPQALCFRSNGHSTLTINEVGEFGTTELFHEQMADFLEIPRKYYNRMRKADPELLDSNVNKWLEKSEGRRMVRTLDGSARAFLSSRYRRLDNHDLAENLLPVFSEIPQLELASCELTESHLYIKAVTPSLEREVKPNDAVRAGVVISNSEVGLGQVKVDPLIYRLKCTNGLIVEETLPGARRRHIGRNVEEIEDAYALYSDETRKADDRAFWMKIADVVRNVLLDVTRFESIVAKMSEASEAYIQGDPVKAVENLSKTYGFKDDETGSVLSHLLSGGELTQYGLVNAVTRTAQDISDYDRATEFESLGGKLLNLPKVDWNLISNN
jgi:hypothetical protein